MTDARSEAVREAFPAVERIADDDLREGVIATWTLALSETGWELAELPWFPPVQHEIGLPDERLVPHVRRVVTASEAMAEAFAAPYAPDLLLAGALVHDVSKCYEFAPPDGAETRLHELLDHPHYGVVPAARAGLPPEVLHVVLAHSSRSAVEPATYEARVVTHADRVAVASVRTRGG